MTRSLSLGAVLLGCLAASNSIHAENMNPSVIDCGSNSLYVLLKLSGYQVDLNAVTQSLPPRHPDGYSMAELQSSARVIGLRLRGVRLGKANLPLDRPAIAFLNHSGSGHFVVLRPVGVTGTMLQVIDPPNAPIVTDYDRVLAGHTWAGNTEGEH